MRRDESNFPVRIPPDIALARTLQDLSPLMTVQRRLPLSPDFARSEMTPGCVGRHSSRCCVNWLDTGLSASTKGLSHVNSLAASFEDLLTAGTFRLWPMASAILRSGMPSSATA